MVVAIAGALGASACDKGAEGSAPPASKGARYTLIRGELPFFDSGCEQERRPDGKLKKGARFTLVQERDGCWLITLEDEVDTYIRPNGNVIQSKRE